MLVITPSPSALEWRESLGEGVALKVEIKMQSSMGVRYPHGEGNQSRLLAEIFLVIRIIIAYKNPITDARNHPSPSALEWRASLGEGVVMKVEIKMR